MKTKTTDKKILNRAYLDVIYLSERIQALNLRDWALENVLRDLIFSHTPEEISEILRKYIPEINKPE